MCIFKGDYVCENIKIVVVCFCYLSGIIGIYFSNGISFLFKFKFDGLVSFIGYFIKFIQVEEVVLLNLLILLDGK